MRDARLHSPAPKDKPFQERVARQPICAVHARVCDLADGVEPLDGCLAAQTGLQKRERERGERGEREREKGERKRERERMREESDVC